MTYFCAIKVDTLDRFVPRDDAKRQKVPRPEVPSQQTTNQRFDVVN